MVRRPRFRVNEGSGGEFTSDADVSSQGGELAAVTHAHREKKKFRGWDELVLSVSIRACGILWPVLRHRGVVIDGIRRQDIAKMQGRPCPVVDVHDTTQAARLLYRLHPERAWTLFVRRGMPRRVIADMFGVELRDLPAAQTMRTRARRRQPPPEG